MAFLFKSKKNADKAQGATKDGSNGVAGSQSSFQRMNEKGAVQQSSTPTSSVNNSMNSLQGGTATPSPDQLNGRRGPSTEQTSDLPVSVPLPKGLVARCACYVLLQILTAIVTEWCCACCSTIDECKPKCLPLPLVSTAINIHDLSSESVSSIWRCC